MRSLAIVLGCCLATASAPARADNPPEAPSRVPAYVGTGVTAAFLITSVVGIFKYSAAIDDHQDKFGSQRDEWLQAYDDAQRWRSVTRLAVGATIVSGAITAYLWSRSERPQTSFAVSAEEHGGSVRLSGNF
jgi:hypothetical protein